ncbi:hypothetical protein ACHWQZ_G002129 [Mnemiopsis leidyi]
MLLLLSFVITISPLSAFVSASNQDCKIEENNGFLKYVCHQDERGLTTRYKCLYSDEYYDYNTNSYFKLEVDACSNDPHFYQACDKRLDGQITNDELLCENYLCSSNTYLMLPYHLTVFGRECNFNCINTDINKEVCNNKIALPTGRSVHPSKICDDVCDASFCEDEATCNGYQYGIYCMKNNKLLYVPPISICNNVENCDDGEDEEDCTVTPSTETFCRHHNTKHIVPVNNYTRCSPMKNPDDSLSTSSSNRYCVLGEEESYQTNCSDPTNIALNCEINGYLSSVSKYLICYNDTKSVCDDHIDSSCYSTKSCKIHKHLLCDQNTDCDDYSDEKNPICLSTTRDTCKRRVGVESELPIPISWLRDGIWDCVDGIDETEDWPKCGIDKTLRYKTSIEEKCENVFVCRTGSPGYELIGNLCDGLENCGNENKICSVSTRFESLTTTVLTSNKGLTKTLSYCLKGLGSLKFILDACVNERFTYPNGDVFGVQTTSVILPQSKQSCDNMYGEQYLYTSCTERCKETSCPLRNVPRYEVCPSQLPDRIGTIVNNEYLIFLTKSFGTLYTNRYFVCDDKIKCIDFSKVCDLVYDCEDGSDEVQCTNHFKCNSSAKLLPKSKKCDGQIDCADLSDECNEQCSKSILEGTILKGLSWLIGLLAVIANLVIIGKSIRTIKQCKTSVTLTNRLLIIMIGLGDMLIGCYLFIIATYDALIFREGYCQRQISWITSFECSAIGVFSTIGSQISLFSMTGLSLVRIHGIWNSMRVPGEITKTQIIKITTAVLSIILVSATIAVIPLMDIYEDYFANGVKFSDELKLFLGTPDKSTVTGVIQAYYGRTKDTTLRWKILIEMVKEMFSHDFDYTDLTENVDKLDFYGNDGVCLFKYFVQDKDPQRLFVWSTLSINLICFLFISVSYLAIGILSRRSLKSLASSNNQQITKRNNRMNRRIAIIITTDFFCWVPFIIICVLHSLEVIDATPWYSIFSMVILPINSVINPFLYDEILSNVIKAPLRSLTMRISNSAALQSLRLRVIPAPTEEMELDRIEIDVGNTDSPLERTVPGSTTNQIAM